MRPGSGLGKRGCSIVGLILTLAILPLGASVKAQTQPETQPSAQAAPQPGAEAVQPAATPALAAAVPTPAPANAALPRDLSPWSMFKNADIVVKVVMVGLALASLVTWTVWLAKGLDLLAAKRRARAATRKLEQAGTLDEASSAMGAGWTRNGAVAALIETAERERERSAELGMEGIKERVAIALSRVEARAGRTMARGTGLLATIGSTAPFVGLFGTVWGIMNSFIGISQAKTTNLAVVAPGIAEALLATATGLVAAIPAVIIYNVFARAILGYRALLSDASGEVLRHLSRDLERSAAAAAQAPAYDAAPRTRLAAGHIRPAE